ncbi:hypothetical protein Pint_06588 [Pistacia integerrima]|uniref:Uncharacterized protein n=1 Tax=Pistacia integerrima TaxID=434235 RepID=A0ACC0Z202_9ROSI|nr:hypothetical protein Pint_06588 [Pistacia integerrima]
MSTSNVSDHNLHTRLDDENYKTCVNYSTNFLPSGGIPFRDKDDNTSVLLVFMLQVILAFVTSRLVYFVLRPLKQPYFVCNVLSGIILGPFGFDPSQKFLDTVFPPREMVVVNSLSMLGGIYFIFIVTMKMDLKRILRIAKNAWKGDIRNRTQHVCIDIHDNLHFMIGNAVDYKENAGGATH